MSLNGKQVDRFGAAVQDCDPVGELGQEGNPGPEAAEANDCGAGRDGQGRFVAGNPGGPGNPFARRVGELRRAMLAAVKPEDVADIIKALVAKAKEGHVQAAKVVLSYVLGKPQRVADPDWADVHEWDLQEETAGMSKGMAEVVKAPPAEVTLRTARVLRPLVGRIVQEQMADMLTNPEKHFPEPPELEIEPAKEGPSPNGFFAKSGGVGKGAEPAQEGPSPNGFFAKSGGVGKGAGGRRVDR